MGVTRCFRANPGTISYCHLLVRGKLWGGLAHRSNYGPMALKHHCREFTTAAELKAAPEAARKPKQIAKFCSSCGGSIELAIPKGETEWRHVCSNCQTVTYYNPKMVVGVICEHDGKILLCKRGIEPCKGLWTLPAGYMEIGESSAEGAARETREEANASVEVVAPYVHFDIPRIGQSYVLFRAKLLPPFTYGPSSESLETVLLPPDSLPLDQIAFSSVSLALRFYIDEMKTGKFKHHHGVIQRAQGASPNDPASYTLENHFALPQ